LPSKAKIFIFLSTFPKNDSSFSNFVKSLDVLAIFLELNSVTEEDSDFLEVKLLIDETEDDGVLDFLLFLFLVDEEFDVLEALSFSDLISFLKKKFNNENLKYN